MSMRFEMALVAVAALCLPVDVTSAATVPAGFTDTQVASGLTKPTAMTFAPDGRLFVSEQAGTLRVIKDGALVATPFLSAAVNSEGERGLLGVAFDPDFAVNQYVYVYYTATAPTIHNRVSRFTADGDVAVPGSETILMDLDTVVSTYHNGGAIHFGTDGKLYVATGDNGFVANAQALTTRFGKVLRINADGTIPEDNPFFATATGDNRSIWAIGLRNPFTFAFQPLSGQMFINDVGEHAWEEINVGTAGANYGWPDTEGETSDPRFASPLYAYSHEDGCSIAGGSFFNPLRPNFPISYWGAYFFADYCGGWIKVRRPDGAVSDFATGVSRPVDVQVAPDGSLYYLARGATATNGAVSRIVYTFAAPIVDVTANGAQGPVVLSLTDQLQIDISFFAGEAGSLPSAEIYIGLSTPFGMFWLDPLEGFAPALSRVASGPTGSFVLSPFVFLGTAGTLPPGAYWWFVLIDDDVDGVPTGDFSDFVLTVIN